MVISYDHSYNRNNNVLLEKGYAELDIHSLSFDRYFTDEEKEENLRGSYLRTREEQDAHCKAMSKKIAMQMLPIIEFLSETYDIHQISEEKSTMDHYRSNYDLLFWSNQGWNEQDYFDHFTLFFNQKRTVKENKKLSEEILMVIETMEVKNVYCRVQYTVRKDEEKIKSAITEICERLLGKPIEYNGMKGKIKLVEENKYGFFKDRTRTSYWEIPDNYLIANYT